MIGRTRRHNEGMAAPTSALGSPKVRWDLTSLYSGVDDPQIEATWKRANMLADNLAARFRGKINSPSLTAELLLEAIQDIEQISVESSKPPTFANLLFAVQSDDQKLAAFMGAQMEQYSALRVKLMFFELELQDLDEAVLSPVMADERLTNYRHYVSVVRSMRDHKLTEKEEILLEEVANVSGRAWVRLFEEVTANHSYEYKNPVTGETEELTEPEVLNLLRDANRDVRQNAGHAFSEGLEKLERVIAFSYNTILTEKKIEDRLRSFPHAESSRHLANELDKETVDLVTGLCRANYDLVARYYRVKREILGLPELTHIDRYAPLNEAEAEVSWEEAKEIVLSSFRAFSGEMADRAEEFFDKDWIDAEARPGKGGGAFCSYITPDLHPVIMLSYLNKMDQVGTLAHELGHGVHASFSRQQTYVNFHGTLPLAELASIFGEMLVFERLMEQATEQDRLALLAEKIEGTFASVFRQVAMYTFEQRAHQARREQGELSPDEFGAIWQEELQAMFGDSVTMGEEHRRWWSYVGHFFFAPFYVYAYAFGELLTMSIYQMAKREGPAFADKYVTLLKRGGSLSPRELMATIGVDLQSREFWQGGIDAIESLITQFESTWSKVK